MGCYSSIFPWKTYKSFVDVFASHGVPEVIKLFAVIDVKKHNICKPTRHQRSMYSGHKRVHCVKFQTVEWGYDKIVRYWAFLDYKKAMKIQQCAILLMWHLAIFLTNCLTCAKGGNQISKFFNIEPPSLEEYLLNVTN